MDKWESDFHKLNADYNKCHYVFKVVFVFKVNQSGQKKNSEETFIKILLEKQIEKHTTAHSIRPTSMLHTQTFYTTLIKVQNYISL